MRCGWDSLFKFDDLVRSGTREYFSEPMAVDRGSVRARVKSEAHGAGAGYRHVVIVVQLQFTGVRECQSDYRHYIGYPAATIAVRTNNWPDRTRFGGETGAPGGQQAETIWLIVPCYTRINARARKTAVVLLHGLAK